MLVSALRNPLSTWRKSSQRRRANGWTLQGDGEVSGQSDLSQKRTRRTKKEPTHEWMYPNVSLSRIPDLPDLPDKRMAERLFEQRAQRLFLDPYCNDVLRLPLEVKNIISRVADANAPVKIIPTASSGDAAHVAMPQDHGVG